MGWMEHTLKDGETEKGTLKKHRGVNCRKQLLPPRLEIKERRLGLSAPRSSLEGAHGAGIQTPDKGHHHQADTDNPGAEGGEKGGGWFWV